MFGAPGVYTSLTKGFKSYYVEIDGNAHINQSTPDSTLKLTKLGVNHTRAKTNVIPICLWDY
jgi:hypothetical protein